MTLRSLMLAGALIALAIPRASPAQPIPGSAMATSENAPILYTVKAGDTLYDLGRAWLNTPSNWRLVQRDNQIRDPRRLTPGSIIRFNPALLKTRPLDAHLAAFSGAVQVEIDGRSVPPRVGLTINEGARLRTGANAFATLELSGESRVTLPSNSAVRVVRLREILLSEAAQRIFVLDEGRSDVMATPSRTPQSIFQIRTPLSVSAVRGTEFRVSANPAAGRAITEVLEGKVGVSSDAAPTGETLTAKGFGVAITAAGVGELTQLLPPPNITRGGRVQSEPVVSFAAEPASGGASYRFQLANDAGFVDIFAEAETARTEAGGGEVSFNGIANGTYFMRATAVDAGGIQGLPRAYSFERDLNTLEAGPPGTETAGKTKRFLFRWSASGEGERTYRFQLAKGDDLDHPIVDLPGLGEPRVTVTDLPAGAYSWRVIATRFRAGVFTEKVGAPQTLRIGE
jgi:hypothetical protein